VGTRETRERLLDAAEQLFGARGFEGTSMRSVTAEAGANLAAVHYHFGSKEELFRAAASRRMGPANGERLRLLDEIEARAGSGALPLEPILDAFFRPVLSMEPRSAGEPSPLRQLAAVVYRERTEVVQPLIADLFGEVARRFVAALGRALPHLCAEEVALRLQFSVGVLIHVTSGHLADVAQPEMPALARDDEALLPAMIAFAAAGLRAPGNLAGREKRGREGGP
jgi:AcrR family transcriptional regulator